MEGGHIKECESPAKLMMDINSLFYSMARDANVTGESGLLTPRD